MFHTGKHGQHLLALYSHKLELLFYYYYLVFMTGTLAVLSESDQGLRDEVHIALIDVEAQEAQASRCTATDTVQELQGLTHQVVLGVALLTQVVLRKKYSNPLDY